ncbi:hypothetical protein CCP3SC15_1050007 [Gammaproteobacteria bacterium]
MRSPCTLPRRRHVEPRVVVVSYYKVDYLKVTLDSPPILALSLAGMES